MLNLIPLPYRILIVAALVASVFGTGVGIGHHWASVSAEAKRVKDIEALNAQIKIQIEHANVISDKLAKAEGKVIIHTVEVIKYVDKVTDGHKCLGSAAVGLLQPGSSQGLNPPTSKPVAEDAGASSSDSDIYTWIAKANQQYETCAIRLNNLVDFEMSKE